MLSENYLRENLVEYDLLDVNLHFDDDEDVVGPEIERKKRLESMSERGGIRGAP
ncbi:hypothetical protein Phum_PHUM449160 [Pediculus humanus corporis]|uniref:Uncharacterized protein n=1 Tax=Pediculus humanus subsp. corporis TaxID=121224 RepID=E0VUD3_PEDHC|nr:uncharacterized protein Phum_PHUM449160 [Pediculus humanus corporis]EEB16989.1 hypothetical protein Phum_PHUM449160 [Pediculus humanus corporis]